MRRDKLLGETMEWFRPRSLAGLNTTHMDSVSMLSERFQVRGRRTEYHTQSLGTAPSCVKDLMGGVCTWLGSK